MQSLLEAIENQNTLIASLLVSARIGTDVKQQIVPGDIDKLITRFKTIADEQQDAEDAFVSMLRCFYREMAFSGHHSDLFNSRYTLMDTVLTYRTGIPVTLGILFIHIANEAGVRVEGVNFPGHFLLRLQVTESRVLFANPLNGQLLSCQELEQMYLDIVDDEEMPEEVLEASSTEQILLRLLHNLKAAFMREEKYTEALQATEMIIQLQPDDPYERRDRGFLLHQLDCAQAAKADYQFFIKHCPQDPAAQLLKLQMRHIGVDNQRILH